MTSQTDPASQTGPETREHSIRLIYNESLALLTDLYQITMAYGYWKAGAADKEAVFHLFFRRHPFRPTGPTCRTPTSRNGSRPKGSPK